MRILLVKPAFARLLQNSVYMTYPIGLMYVAAMLRGLGHDVAIWHDDVSNTTAPPIPHKPASFHAISMRCPGPDVMEPLENFVDEWGPEVVGVGYNTIDWQGAHAVAQMAKLRGIRTVAGGVHPSLLPDEELGKDFDGVVIGEGDHESLEMAFTWDVYPDSPGARLPAKFDALSPSQSVFELGVLPARDAVIGHELYPPYLRGIVQTQRGCPYNCGYCAAPQVFGRKVKARSPESVRQDVESLGVSHGRIIDDSFFVLKEHSRRVCYELAETDYTWVCDMALQDATDDALDHIRIGGCTGINVGVESASPRWRELSGKKIRAGEPESLIERAGSRGIGVVFYFMIGFPGETASEIKATLNYARRLKQLGAKPCISLVTPYPKTRLWDAACGRKDMENSDWSEFIHQNSQTKLADCTDEEWTEAVERGNEIN